MSFQVDDTEALEVVDGGEVNSSATPQVATTIPSWDNNGDSSNDLISFKRKIRPSTTTFTSILATLITKIVHRASSTSGYDRCQTRHEHVRVDPTDSLESLRHEGDSESGSRTVIHNPKQNNDSGSYVERPDSKVAYENFSAIDWLFEYAKERRRIRLLHSKASGLLGQIIIQADFSQIWWVLVATGVAIGVIAGAIGVASDWLEDLKSGFCVAGSDGWKLYLNKAFCCWGYSELTQCREWKSWGSAVGIHPGKANWFFEYFIFVTSSVMFAALASVLVTNYAVHAKHSGIPEIKTILSGFVIKQFMGGWTLIIKSLGLCLATASGLWLGKEGPLVHVACCCANLCMTAFKTLGDNEARKREVFSAAAAAGISVAFGSPVGGVLFSLEQLSYYFPDKTMWQSFVCAMIAAVTLQAFNPFRTGKLVLFQVNYDAQWHSFELLPFAVLGALGGVYGGLLIKLNMIFAQWRRVYAMSQHAVLEVIVVSFATAVVSFPNRLMRVQLSELVYALFIECSEAAEDQLQLCKSGPTNAAVIASLFLAAILAFFFSAFTFGLRIPAGIILPSMAIGALYGRAIGLIVQSVQENYSGLLVFSTCEPSKSCITPGIYAVIGAASALGGATRMTVSIVVIMFELTGALTYVLPIMVAVLISKWSGDWIGRRGIYESWIHFNGYPVLDDRQGSAEVMEVPVSQVMARVEDLVVITSSGHTIGSLKDMLSSHHYRGFPIINNPRHALLLGYISRSELAFALDFAISSSGNLSTDTECYFTHPITSDSVVSVDLRPWMDHTPITLNARASLQLTVNVFHKLGIRYVLFVEKGLLRGILTRKDVWFILGEGNVCLNNLSTPNSEGNRSGAERQ